VTYSYFRELTAHRIPLLVEKYSEEAGYFIFYGMYQGVLIGEEEFILV